MQHINRMRSFFVADNKAIFDDIIIAVCTGDIKQACRLVYSLKSGAEQIGEKSLKETAAAVEKMLSEDMNNPDDGSLLLLGAELNMVLNRLAPFEKTCSLLEM